MNHKDFQIFFKGFFERLGRLLSEGVPLLKAVQAAETGLSDQDERRSLIRQIAVGLENGRSLSECLTATGRVPAPVVEILASGEKNGLLDEESLRVSEMLSSGELSWDREDHEGQPNQKGNSDEERDAYIRLTNRLIIDAIRAGASDIHIDPELDSGRVRFRLDGVLQRQPVHLNRAELTGLISRIKVMADLDVCEHRLPQDGRILIRHTRDDAEKSTVMMDLRVSICPYIRGEKAVIRILDKSMVPESLDVLGMTEAQKSMLRQWMQSPCGMILVSGPTGSGKTTTLYMMLKEIAAREFINVISIEDPVEYILDGVYQMQIDPSLGLTYPAVLRSVLRQDPDVISVGEIREVDTARALAQTAQCGHLALTQLHAHNAASAIKLMHDLGVPDHTLKEIIIGVASQRLVRRLCPQCKTRMIDPANLPGVFHSIENPVYRAKGCEACHQTGYKGRLMVIELLEPRKKFWDALAGGASREELAACLPDGFQNMLADGLRLVSEGKTSPEEIIRVLI